MAETTTNRFGMPRYGADSDPFGNLRSRLTAIVDSIESNGAKFSQTTDITTRPAASSVTAGQIHIAGHGPTGSFASVSDGVSWLGLGGFVDFRDYTPYGELIVVGSADHTAALTAAINAARGRSLPLYIPPGYYRVTSTIDYEGVRIIGAGPAKTWIYCTASGAAAFEGDYAEMHGLQFLTSSGCSDIINVTGKGCHLTDIVITAGDIGFSRSGIRLVSDAPGSGGPLSSVPVRWVLDRVAVSGAGGSTTTSGIIISGDGTLRASDVYVANCGYGVTGDVGTLSGATITNLQCLQNNVDVRWRNSAPLRITGGSSTFADRLLVVDTAANAQVALRDVVFTPKPSPTDAQHIKWDSANGVLSMDGVRFPAAAGITPKIGYTGISSKVVSLVTQSCAAVTNPTAAGLLTITGGGTVVEKHNSWQVLSSGTGNVSSIVQV